MTCLDIIMTNRGVLDAVLESETRCVFSCDDNAYVVLFTFKEIKAIDVNNISAFLNETRKFSPVKEIIILRMNKMTAYAKKALLEISKSLSIHITLFSYSELMFDIGKHYYQPISMRKLVGDEREAVIERWGFSQLPQMEAGDMMSKWKGFYRNDIIEIIRKDNSVYYRRVK